MSAKKKINRQKAGKILARLNEIPYSTLLMTNSKRFVNMKGGDRHDRTKKG
jgi:hypothetical protein